HSSSTEACRNEYLDRSRFPSFFCEIESMISSSPSLFSLPSPAAVVTASPVKSPPVAVDDRAPETPTAPRPPASLRLRRSIELENPPTGVGELMGGQPLGY